MSNIDFVDAALYGYAEEVFVVVPKGAFEVKQPISNAATT
jgi:hypothetical protein